MQGREARWSRGRVWQFSEQRFRRVYKRVDSCKFCCFAIFNGNRSDGRSIQIWNASRRVVRDVNYPFREGGGHLLQRLREIGPAYLRIILVGRVVSNYDAVR